MNDQKAQLIADELRDVMFQLKRIADVLESYSKGNVDYPFPVEIGEPKIAIKDMDEVISAVRHER